MTLPLAQLARSAVAPDAPRRICRPAPTALLGAAAVLLLIAALFGRSDHRVLMLAPLSSEQLQDQRARPDVLNVQPPPSPDSNPYPVTRGS